MTYVKPSVILRIKQRQPEDVNSMISEFKSNFDMGSLNELMQKQYDAMLNQFNTMFSTFKNEFEQTILSRMDGVNKNLQNVVDSMPQAQSYASIASTSKSSFILKPKNSVQPTTVTKSDMLRNINPVTSNINIAKVKNARNGSVVVYCENGEESVKFEELARGKLGDKYDVKQLATLNPRLKVVGMSEKFEDNVLLEYIMKQNKHLFGANSQCKIINITTLRKNRNIYQAILQLDKLTYNKVLNCGKLFIGYDYCSVFDAIDLRRCFKCCGFHHLANHCSLDKHICPRCSEFHSVKECKSDVFKCVHCSKLDKSLQISTAHAVWDPNCHVYKETLKKFKADILGTGTD